MHIVISTEPGNYSIGKQHYLIKMLVEEWISKHQDHQFYIITNRQVKKEAWPLYPNLHIINLPVKPALPLYKWRYRNHLNSFIKKTGAQVFLSFDSDLLVTKNLLQYSFITRPPSKKIRNLEAAKGIITLLQWLKQKLKEDYNIHQDKILVVYGGADRQALLSEEEKILVKEMFSDGKEYFLCFINSVPQENVIQLLKAFSIFKKRQKTSMRLVLVGKAESSEQKFESLINTYKYKDEIVVLNELSAQDKSRLTAAAYAIVSVDEHNGDLLSELNIIGAEVPLLATHSSVLKELTSEGALYFDLTDTNDVADKLMLIYKDESFRNGLISKGNELMQNYNWPSTAESVWQMIQDK